MIYWRVLPEIVLYTEPKKCQKFYILLLESCSISPTSVARYVRVPPKEPLLVVLL